MRARALIGAAAWVGAALLSVGAARAEISAPLTLAEVLDALDETHPELAQAELDVRRARASALSADGAFDPTLYVGAKKYVLGEYDKGQLEVLLSQATPLWGTELYAGWRRSLGDKIPIYDGHMETLSGGELRVGLEVPLWRNGPIDKRRAGVRKAQLASERSELELASFRLLLRNAAARAYWKWVEAGLKLEVERRLLALAQTRNDGIRKRAEKGEAAGILALDSERSVLTRQARVVAAERDLKQAALKLSLFYRGADREPIVPAPARLPTALPEPTAPAEGRVAEDVARALRARPDLQALQRSLAAAQVDVTFAENQVAPDISLWSEVAQDVGRGKSSLDPFDWAVGLTVKAPLLLREARGEESAARAKRLAAREKIRGSEDKLRAEVHAAYTTLEASYRSASLARRAREAAEALAEAERRRLALGSSDLLVLTIRETTAADSAKTEISAMADFQRALADYLTTTARGLEQGPARK